MDIKMKFDLEYFKNNKVAINCETEDEAKELIRVLKEYGIKWYNGDELDVEATYWNYYEKNTYYKINTINKLSYGYNFYKNNNYKIIKFKYIEFKRKKDMEKKLITVEELKNKTKEINNCKWIEYNYDYTCILKCLNDDNILWFDGSEFGYDDIDNIIEELKKVKKQIEELRQYELDKNECNKSWNKAYNHMKNGGIVKHGDIYYRMENSDLYSSIDENFIKFNEVNNINFKLLQSKDWILINE